MTRLSNEQVRIRAVVMRGGSSKAVFLDESDVPRDTEQRTRFLLALFGSPDRRQIDGLGGADLLTSKCALMGRASRPDADIDYTFVQVSVEDPVVSYDISCGNITSAVGVYAIEEGYVQPRAPVTEVRVHNTNTGRLLRIAVPVRDGAPVVEGDFTVDGVPGSGAEISVDFSDTAGSVTGKVLPTGNVRDRIAVGALGIEVDVSIVDVANPCVFVDAEQLGLTGVELPDAVPPRILEALEEIRRASCALAGMASHLLPFQVIVARPRSYAGYVRGTVVTAEQCDVLARLFVDRTMHKAYPGTGATCLAVAAGITGTVVHAQHRLPPGEARMRIGHPSGVLPILADVALVGEAWTVRKAAFSRTARRLMEGLAYVRKARVESPPAMARPVVVETNAKQFLEESR